LLYGITGGLLIVLMRLVEYKYLVIENSVAMYGGLVAALFTCLGIYFGLKLTRTKEVIVEVPVNSPGVPFKPDEKKKAELGITNREFEILEHMARGLSNREIANTIFVSENTVKTHTSKLFEKLNAKRRTQAVQNAKNMGLIP